MPTTPSGPSDDRVEAAARDAMTLDNVWLRLVPDVGSAPLKLVIQELIGKSYSPDEATAAIDRHVREGRLRVIQFDPAIVLETTVLMIPWLESGREPDGPVPPDQFRFDGKTAKLPLRLFRLADYLYGRHNWSARLTDVIDHVYDGVVGDGTLRSYTSKLSAAFVNDGVLLSVQLKGGYVTMVDTRPKAF